MSSSNRGLVQNAAPCLQPHIRIILKSGQLLRCCLLFSIYWRVRTCLVTKMGHCPLVKLVIFHGQLWEHRDRGLSVNSHRLLWASDPVCPWEDPSPDSEPS